MFYFSFFVRKGMRFFIKFYLSAAKQNHDRSASGLKQLSLPIHCLLSLYIMTPFVLTRPMRVAHKRKLPTSSSITVSFWFTLHVYARVTAWLFSSSSCGDVRHRRSVLRRRQLQRRCSRIHCLCLSLVI